MRLQSPQVLALYQQLPEIPHHKPSFLGVVAGLRISALLSLATFGWDRLLHYLQQGGSLPIMFTAHETLTLFCAAAQDASSRKRTADQLKGDCSRQMKSNTFSERYSLYCCAGTLWRLFGSNSWFAAHRTAHAMTKTHIQQRCNRLPETADILSLVTNTMLLAEIDLLLFIKSTKRAKFSVLWRF